MSKNIVKYLETEENGMHLTLAFPEKTVEDESLRKDIKNILSHTLQQYFPNKKENSGRKSYEQET